MMFQALVQEIEEIYCPAYLTESAKLVGDTTEVQKARATTIGAKIRMLKSLGLPEATRLKVTIGKAGWNSATNGWLSDLVDETVAKNALPKMFKRCTQRCMTWELYPTEKDWELLGDRNAPWSSKFEHTKRFNKKLGLMLPSETTRGRILEALLLANHLPIERDRTSTSS